MPREKVIGSYLIRLTEDEGRMRVHLQDLKRGEALEFETWVAAWAFVDRLLHDSQHPDPGSPDPRR